MNDYSTLTDEELLELRLATVTKIDRLKSKLKIAAIKSSARAGAAKLDWRVRNEYALSAAQQECQLIQEEQGRRGRKRQAERRKQKEQRALRIERQFVEISKGYMSNETFEEIMAEAISRADETKAEGEQRGITA